MDFVPVCLIKNARSCKSPPWPGRGSRAARAFIASGRPGNTEPRQTDQLFERDIRRRSGVGCKLTDVVVEPIGGEVQFCRDLYNKRLEVLTRPKNCVHILSAFTQTVGEHHHRATVNRDFRCDAARFGLSAEQSERSDYGLLVHTTRRRRRRKRPEARADNALRFRPLQGKPDGVRLWGLA